MVGEELMVYYLLHQYGLIQLEMFPYTIFSHLLHHHVVLICLTFFTVGQKEARAWTVISGATAPQAAGVIHTDFQRGFIRAETISYDDYIACEGESGAKDAGKFRIEGADYKVNDGDVFHFRFNV